jgi:four helix bundle protein
VCLRQKKLPRSGRDNPKEKKYFYRIAKGSVYEVVSLLVMAGKRGALSREKYRELYQEADEIAAMISGAMTSTTAKSQGARGKSKRG